MGAPKEHNPWLGPDGHIDFLRVLLATAFELGLVGVSMATMYLLTANTDPQLASILVSGGGMGTAAATSQTSLRWADRIVHKNQVS